MQLSSSVLSILALSLAAVEALPLQQIDSSKPYSQEALDQFNILRLLGTASPYVQNPGYGIQRNPPSQCKVTQANLLSRHGERYPKEKKIKEMKENFAVFTNSTDDIDGPLKFLKDYNFKVFNDGMASEETDKGPYAGLLDLYTHGTNFRARYDDLYKDGDNITFWAASSSRVVDSAKAFGKGFLGDDYDKSFVHKIDEDDDSLGANSLTPWCNTFDEDANKKIIKSLSNSYMNKTAERLNAENPGLELTEDTIESLFYYCGYELQQDGSSAICDIFNDDELVSYSYSLDVESFYQEGPGNNLSSTIGSVYIDAVIRLLKDESKNLTLSFTHSGDIFFAASALGLFDDGSKLPVDHQSFNHLWKTSNITPMGARMIFERLECKGEDEQFVRIIHNDAVIPITGYSEGPGFSTSISNFEKYISDRLEGKDFASDCEIADGAPESLTFFWN